VDLVEATEVTTAVETVAVSAADLQDAAKALAMSEKAALTTALTQALSPHPAVTSRRVETLHPVQISPHVEILRRERRLPVVILERPAVISLHASRPLVNHLVLPNREMAEKYLFRGMLKNVPRATQTKSVDQAMPLRRASSRNKAAWSKSAMPFFMPWA
jgi:hypothetical protein